MTKSRTHKDLKKVTNMLDLKKIARYVYHKYSTVSALYINCEKVFAKPLAKLLCLKINYGKPTVTGIKKYSNLILIHIYSDSKKENIFFL